MDIADVLKHTSPELFIADMQGTDKAEALNELVDALIAGTDIKNKETILQMLQSRENLGSTAVGPGVAFPHGRTVAVQRLTILIGRHPAGVDFDSEDGDPTHLFLGADRTAPGFGSSVHQIPGRPDRQGSGRRVARQAAGGRDVRRLLRSHGGGLIMHPQLQLLVALQDMEEMIREVEEKGDELEEMGFKHGGLDDLKKAKEELIAKIDPRQLSWYNRVAAKHGRAVVPVVSNLCTGCFNNIPSSFVSSTNANRVQKCESCGRILYWP